MAINDNPFDAYVINSIPFYYVQDCAVLRTGIGLPSTCGAANTRNAWFKYTPPSVPAIFSFYVRSNSSSTGCGPFDLQMSVWHGTDPANITNYNGLCEDSVGLGGVWWQVVVSDPGDYWFQFGCNLACTTIAVPLNIQFITAPTQYAPTGSVFITNDTPSLPGMVISSSTGDALRAVPAPSGEFGDIVPTGEMCLSDNNDVHKAYVFDQNVTLLGTLDLTGIGGAIGPIKSDRNSTFYIAYSTGGGAAWHVTTMSKAGVQGGTTWNLPHNASGCFTPDRSGSILYYMDRSNTASPVYRFDLINNVALTDLAAGVANSLASAGDGFVAQDGTIFMGYTIFSPPTTAPFIRRYTTGGSIQQTYTFTNHPTGLSVSRLNHFAIDPDEVSFWIWDKTGGATFYHYAFGGYLLGSVSREQSSTESANPWPVSGSCPLLILNQPMGTAPPTPPSPPAPSGCVPVIPIE